MNERKTETDLRQEKDEVRRKQPRPVAGIWYCSRCERRIQVLTEGSAPMAQPFVCVCGSPMEPGEEHTVIGQ